MPRYQVSMQDIRNVEVVVEAEDAEVAEDAARDGYNFGQLKHVDIDGRIDVLDVTPLKPLTLDRLLERGIGQCVRWHREDGETWEMTAIANGGVLGAPRRVMLIKFGTIGEGIYTTDLDRLSLPPAGDPQYDEGFTKRL